MLAIFFSFMLVKDALSFLQNLRKYDVVAMLTFIHINHILDEISKVCRIARI